MFFIKILWFFASTSSNHCIWVELVAEPVSVMLTISAFVGFSLALAVWARKKRENELKMMAKASFLGRFIIAYVVL